MNISSKIEAIQDSLKTVRRDLHQIPEVGFEEFKTSEYITTYLDGLGIQYEKNILGTGVIAHIQGSEGKKTLGFRADMDALSVEEKNDIDFKSLHGGCMHACGHDGHMTILLGLAKYLSEHRDELKDNVVLLFQPAEEGPGGALPMVEEGYLKKYKIDEIYGLHLFPDIEEGKFGVRPGPMMSQTGEFDIHIKGLSGHGAMPHKGIDSIVIASEMIIGMQSIVSRNINPIQPAVMTIGRVVAGERRNVIAKEAILEGTIRSFHQEVYDTIKARMVDFASGLEKMYHCQIEVVFRDMYPAVVNDDFLTNEFINSQHEGTIQMVDPIMLAEDFSYFQQVVPGVFFFLGCRNEEKNYCYPLHNDQFNFDEKVLGYGLQAYMNILKQRGSLV
ncbi:M20 metallopeptidase family protein [Alkaliphilus transvaalensis]|uniref:M20 metallopeptidase family protein n=1 Tax=Alkaliphilus transvaalensis TaxID=114628 RepID=UPI00047E58B3|nr:M20 family metallopeptidase [Alkaliphilus transvaalensis]